MDSLYVRVNMVEWQTDQETLSEVFIRDGVGLFVNIVLVELIMSQRYLQVLSQLVNVVKRYIWFVLEQVVANELVSLQELFLLGRNESSVRHHTLVRLFASG